jgi:hypothetical protein
MEIDGYISLSLVPSFNPCFILSLSIACKAAKASSEIGVRSFGHKIIPKGSIKKKMIYLFFDWLIIITGPRRGGDI